MKSKPKQKLGPNQRRWIKALRSGRYKRTNFVLHSRETSGMCCLGVACSVFGMKPVPSIKDEEKVFTYGSEQTLAPVTVIRKLALHDESGTMLDGFELWNTRSLAEANDAGAHFKAIAAFCEAHPEAVFKEAK